MSQSFIVINHSWLLAVVALFSSAVLCEKGGDDKTQGREAALAKGLPSFF